MLSELFDLSANVYNVFSKLWWFMNLGASDLEEALIETGFNRPVAEGGAVAGNVIMQMFVEPFADLFPNTSILSLVLSYTIFVLIFLGIFRFVKEIIFP